MHHKLRRESGRYLPSTRCHPPAERTSSYSCQLRQPECLRAAGGLRCRVRGWVAGVDQREPPETTGAGVEISINLRHQVSSGGADDHDSTVPPGIKAMTRHRKSIDEPGHAHELTFSCDRRFPFLQSDRTCQWFAEAIESARAEYSFRLWPYVFSRTMLIWWCCPPKTDIPSPPFSRRSELPSAERRLSFWQPMRPTGCPGSRERADRRLNGCSGSRVEAMTGM